MSDRSTIETKVAKILKDHDIYMEIGGCGCCGSPWVTFIYKGETICEDEEHLFIGKEHYKDDYTREE